MTASDIEPDLPDQYQAFVNAANLVNLSEQSCLELSGADRASFLHNLCTNEVRKLLPGEGCEAYFTNVQGKILFHGQIFCGPDSLRIHTVPGMSQALLAHLDRYLIREKVELRDCTAACCSLLLAGHHAKRWLQELGVPVPQQRLSHVDTTLCTMPVRIHRVDMTPNECYLLTAPATGAQSLTTYCVEQGVTIANEPLWNALRIEAGFPWYGVDIADDNLPQEVARDRKAISFVKGCYLGQETVARIDALGHVNRLLCRLRFHDGPVPSRGTELLLPASDKVAGRVTSAAFSPQLNCALALAYVRRGNHTPGTVLSSAQGTAEVLPACDA